MSWNYRIVAEECPHHDETPYMHHTIREVYYRNGEVSAWSTAEGALPAGGGIDELREVMSLMLKAFDAPVLKEVDNKLIPYKDENGEVI